MSEPITRLAVVKLREKCYSHRGSIVVDAEDVEKICVELLERMDNDLKPSAAASALDRRSTPTPHAADGPASVIVQMRGQT